MLNKIKFRFIIIFILFLSVFSHLYGNSTPNFGFQIGCDSNIYKYSEHEDYGFYSIFTAKFQKLKLDAGIRVDQIKTDIFADSLFIPETFQKFKLGIISTGHFYQYQDLFYELDFLPGIYFQTIPDDYFTFDFVLCYFGKFSVIHSIKDAKPVLPSNSLGLILGFNWDFDFCSLFFKLQTYDYFDYPIFCSPIFIFGGEKNIFNLFTIGAKFTSEWIDMFTIEASPTVMTLSTYVKAGL